ncbi:MAG: purine-nucleoside phosphorylase [Pseudomonadota bacterium]
MNLQNYFKGIDEAAGWLKGRMKIAPEILVVLSGGLDAFAVGLSERTEIASGDIPHFPVARAQGHAGKLFFGRHSGVPLVVMDGRYHCYEGHSPQTVVFPHFVMARLGVGTLILTSAAGGINPAFRCGDIVAVTDHINMMGVNPLVDIALERKTDQFTNMIDAYDKGLLKIAGKVAAKKKIRLKKGVYIATSGPSYETPAETKAFRKMGADVVGMSTVPEVIAARFLGLKVLSLSCVANAAAHLHKGRMSHAEVLATMDEAAPKMVELLRGVIEELKK